MISRTVNFRWTLGLRLSHWMMRSSNREFISAGCYLSNSVYWNEGIFPPLSICYVSSLAVSSYSECDWEFDITVRLETGDWRLETWIAWLTTKMPLLKWRKAAYLDRQLKQLRLCIRRWWFTCTLSSLFKVMPCPRKVYSPGKAMTSRKVHQHKHLPSIL